MNGSTEHRWQDLLGPTVQALGYELWGVEFLRQGRRSVLRLFIDTDVGVTVDDCAIVSRQVSALLDVEDPISGEYNLEVSSPGMDRPLFTLGHYQRYVGEDIALRLRVPQAGRRRFQGRLAACTEDGIVLVMEDNEYRFALDAIDSARLQPRFDDSGDEPPGSVAGQ